MAENMLSNRPDYGRTFNTAMWLVGLIASIQLFAVVWAVFANTGDPSPPYRQGAVPIPAGVGSGVNPSPSEGKVLIQNETLPPIPAEIRAAIEQQKLESYSSDSRASNLGGKLPGNIGVSRPVGDSEFSNTEMLPEPLFYGPADAPPSLSEVLASAVFTAERIEDPILERLVSTGKELRGEGNISSALQALRQAEDALPDHPRVLAEMAVTLSQMGANPKADNYWQKLVDIGPVSAGAYYKLARQQLAGEGPAAVDKVEKLMSIGEIRVDEAAPGSEGQKVALRIVIDSDPALKPVGDQLSLLVYFYDLVDGERIDASTADTSYLYPTEPYDWQTNGTEEIVVNYDQPVFTEEQRRDLGERRYYGYTIELYYRDRLQDRVVRPPEIAHSRIGESGLNSDAAPKTFGPENALFPDTPNL